MHYPSIIFRAVKQLISLIVLIARLIFFNRTLSAVLLHICLLHFAVCVTFVGRRRRPIAVEH